MKVKEIIKKTAKMLDMTDVCNYLNEDVEATEGVLEDLEKLLLACNIVNGTIASQYVEVIDVIESEVNNGIISVADFTDKNIIEIKEISNGNGVSVEYKIFGGKIYVDASFVKIKFSYFPKDLSLGDNIDYYLKIDEYVFAQGVVAEYLFLKGDFEESNIFDTRFKNAIGSLLRPKRNIITASKRWI